MRKSIYYLFLLIGLIPFSAFSQFTYVDFGVSHSNLNINGRRGLFGDRNTQLKTSQIHIGGLWRFNRIGGIGLDLGIPFINKSSFTLADSETVFSGKQDPIENFTKGYYDTRYLVSKLDYAFKRSPQLTVIGRLFVVPDYHLFVDIRVSALKIEEHFRFERRAMPAIDDVGTKYDRPAIDAVSINDTYSRLSIVPGFAIGWQPHLGERFFMNFNLAYDFYTFKKNSFSYVIPYDFNNVYEQQDYVNLKSQLTGTKLAFTGTIRFGMFF